MQGRDYIGKEFTAYGTDAYASDGKKVELGGTWMVMDWDHTERGEFFVLAPKAIESPPYCEREDVSELFVTCDPMDVIREVDPLLYASILKSEKQLDEAEQYDEQGRI